MKTFSVFKSKYFLFSAATYIYTALILAFILAASESMDPEDGFNVVSEISIYFTIVVIIFTLRSVIDRIRISAYGNKGLSLRKQAFLQYKLIYLFTSVFFISLFLSIFGVRILFELNTVKVLFYHFVAILLLWDMVVSFIVIKDMSRFETVKSKELHDDKIISINVNWAPVIAFSSMILIDHHVAPIEGAVLVGFLVLFNITHKIVCYHYFNKVSKTAMNTDFSARDSSAILAEVSSFKDCEKTDIEKKIDDIFGVLNWYFFGFAVPPAGIIVFFIWRKKRPKDAIASLFGFITAIAVFYVLGVVSFYN